MKIRIKDNAVRFRLTRSEVRQLSEQFYIHSKTEFNTQVFHYEIKASDEYSHLSADFSDNTISLFFPKHLAQEWYANDLITHENVIKLNNGASLKLLLEKDFVCLDHTDEDQSDNYANPNKTC
jgi:hypothetical protein